MYFKEINELKRLKVSILTIDSLDSWYKLQFDGDVMKYIADGTPRNVDEAKASLQKSIQHYKDHGFCLFEISLTETEEFIGQAG